MTPKYNPPQKKDKLDFVKIKNSLKDTAKIMERQATGKIKIFENNLKLLKN